MLLVFIYSQNWCIVLQELHESKKLVKNDTFFIKSYYILTIVLQNDEPGVLKYINFMLKLCDKLDVLYHVTPIRIASE